MHESEALTTRLCELVDDHVNLYTIMSLVYNRGTILASKRVSYEDLLAGEFDEKKLADRVGRQHKLICAAVKAGHCALSRIEAVYWLL